jgi:hypothetical protein
MSQKRQKQNKNNESIKNVMANINVKDNQNIKWGCSPCHLINVEPSLER